MSYHVHVKDLVQILQASPLWWIRACGRGSRNAPLAPLAMSRLCSLNCGNKQLAATGVLHLVARGCLIVYLLQTLRCSHPSLQWRSVFDRARGLNKLEMATASAVPQRW